MRVCTRKIFVWNHVCGSSIIPYSGKFSREKTFTKTAIVKISRRKLSRIHTIDWIWVAHACNVRKENFREHAQIHKIRESFPLYSSMLSLLYINSLQDYLEAGADFVETNTFNGTAVSQSDYGTQELVS